MPHVVAWQGRTVEKQGVIQGITQDLLCIIGHTPIGRTAEKPGG